MKTLNVEAQLANDTDSRPGGVDIFLKKSGNIFMPVDGNGNPINNVFAVDLNFASDSLLTAKIEVSFNWYDDEIREGLGFDEQ